MRKERGCRASFGILRKDASPFDEPWSASRFLIWPACVHRTLFTWTYSHLLLIFSSSDGKWLYGLLLFSPFQNALASRQLGIFTSGSSLVNTVNFKFSDLWIKMWREKKKKEKEQKSFGLVGNCPAERTLYIVQNSSPSENEFPLCAHSLTSENSCL